MDSFIPASADSGTPDAARTLPDLITSSTDSSVAPPDGSDDGPDASMPSYSWRQSANPPSDIGKNPPACSPNDWLSKFLAYRTRFRGDGTAANPGFVAIGSGSGMGIPATVRGNFVDCANDYRVSGCTNKPIPMANGSYNWGDSTIWVGWYLRALGAEYVALTDLNVDTTQTIADIALVLDTLDRLDSVAETYFGKPPALDGFFIRDDITQEIVWTDSTHTKLRFPRNDNGLIGYACVGSDSNCGTVSTVNGSFISQDQFIEMLPGLAMIAKLVPDSVMVNGKSLSYRAREFTHRVTSYLKKNNWKIVDPNGQSPPNAWGGSAAPYSTQIAAATNFITGNAFGVADYSVAGSVGEAAAFAEGAAAWAGVDAGWSLETLNNQSMILSLASVTDVWNDDKLSARATDWDSPIFAMINALLHGRPLPSALGHIHIESMLSSAPCGGPCHGTTGCEEVPGWKGAHRFKNPEDRDGDVYGVLGEYGGLDYMLLWGLYVHMSTNHTQQTWDSPPRCSGPSGLDTILQTGSAGTTQYDPNDACNLRDFGTTFCGRPFATWLDAAYHGSARIFIAGGELVCSGAGPCLVVKGANTGSSGEDLFIGSPGNDTFAGGDGDDCLYGFDGNDNLSGELGSDEIHGGAGNDTLCGESCNFTDINGGPDIIFGDDGDDTISGGPGPDVLLGGAGNDTITGATGWDSIEGNDGDDNLDGEIGDDICEGGNGNDRVIGGVGNDVLRGGPGRDKLDGGEGNDVIYGGTGDDFLMGSAGNDTLWGEEGSDRLCGGCGDDTLFGGWDAGKDECRGGEAASICISDKDQVNECEVSLDGILNAPKCLDAAFNNW